MKQIHTAGLDIGRRVSQIHAISDIGEIVLTRRLPTKEVACAFEKVPPCLIGMEACSGSNQLAQSLLALGHNVRLIPPAYVKPYLKTNKSDANDAEAICEAVGRPNMRFVPVKSSKQQAALMLHRTRALLSKQKASLINSMKAGLAEFGIVVAKHSRGTADAVRAISNSTESGLPSSARSAFGLLLNQMKATESQIVKCQKLIDAIHKETASSLRLATVPGIGVLAATALVATVDNASAFPSGRSMAAWLGLVPAQRSSGERPTLIGISKRGDSYLRRLLVIGAMSLMRAGLKSKYRMVHWAINLANRKCYKVAVVALANKIARIAWAVLAKGRPFKECPQ